MKERTTQALLGAVVVLLVIHLFRGTDLPPAQAGTDAQVPDVLRCRMLEVVDEHGRVRASIKLHPPNPKVTLPNGKTLPETVMLRLIDQNGRPSVKLGCSVQGAGLGLGGESDPTYARIVSDLQHSSLTLINKDGRQKMIDP
ncbi:MAG TPA: hypothetical protein VFG04_02195 [Planctomycetaceae bacterium]|jgi:hypothetical protein|nr:hypothetical protein [Planctomycetaceae bacterium]